MSPVKADRPRVKSSRVPATEQAAVAQSNAPTVAGSDEPPGQPQIAAQFGIDATAAHEDPVRRRDRRVERRVEPARFALPCVFACAARACAPRWRRDMFGARGSAAASARNRSGMVTSIEITSMRPAMRGSRQRTGQIEAEVSH